MQPVEPSTIVRGPAALTMSFITRADSQPWQVRWPEVKYSSIVTFLTPLKGSRICVAFVNAVSGIGSISLVCARLNRSVRSARLRLSSPGHGCSSQGGHSLTPSQWVLRSDLPDFAAAKHMSAALATSSSVTSRPPSPQMKLSSGGRRSELYIAARISLATTPELKGEPNE